MAARVAGRHHHRPSWTADEALAALYTTHCRALVRLAALLAGDAGAAEEIAGAAFADMHRAWASLRPDEQSLLTFLRRRVLVRARAWRRGRRVPSGPADTAATPLLAAIDLPGGRELEALVLACYAGLTAAEIASLTGTTAAAATRSIRRGLAALAKQPTAQSTRAW